MKKTAKLIIKHFLTLIAIFAIVASTLVIPPTVYSQSQPNDCYNNQSDIYNTPDCQEVRQQYPTRDSISQTVERLKCERTKRDGAVYVVFLQKCITFEEFFPVALNYILTIASVIAAVVFIRASFNYLSSRGDPSKLADARDMLQNAVIGLVIIALSYVIIQVINSSFSGVGNINILPFWP